MKTNAATASISIADCALAAVWLNVCFSRVHPPTSIDAPITSSTLPMIDPTIDAFTTSWRPSMSAKKAMISSGALPKVTFRRPPMPGPVRAAIASVASPITAAQGITPSAAAPNTITGPACASSTRDRDRDEHPEVVHGTHGRATLRGTVSVEHLIDHVNNLKLQHLVELSKLGDGCAAIEEEIEAWLAEHDVVFAGHTIPFVLMPHFVSPGQLRRVKRAVGACPPCSTASATPTPRTSACARSSPCRPPKTR